MKEENISFEVCMPSVNGLGHEFTLIEWKVSDGDRISYGDIVAEVESPVASMEIESFADGYIKKLVVEGEVLSRGSTIAVVSIGSVEYLELAKQSELIKVAKSFSYEELRSLDSQRGSKSREEYISQILKLRFGNGEKT